MQQDIVKRFFTGTGGTYDTIVNLFTYGADRYWKRRMLSQAPASRKILELACGTGILMFRLADKFPDSQIVGVDMMHEYIAIARRRVQTRGYKNIQLICARAEHLQLREQFDCVISSYIPKYVAADELMTAITPNLKAGGKLILHDFTYPKFILFKKMWALHMAILKHVGTRFYPQWRTIFYELADLVKTTRWLSDYTATLKKLGYQNLKIKRLTGGSAAILSANL
ncbi:MAG: class I SAM-dependent methyltransferase [bacterium]